ncbi:MAG TPA: hypothetical protein VMY35_09030 [Phycisphaerae bacterium]|nr:hypothetical protein [Phycisphaerae bacterium]
MPVRVRCPKCGTAAEFSESLIGEIVQCPSCRQRLKLNKPVGVAPEKDAARRIRHEAGTRHASLWHNPSPAVWLALAAVTALVVGLIIVVSLPNAAPPKWVKISYGDLVDVGRITHSGERLDEVIGKPDLRREAQPFLEPYASLLPHAVDMLCGPSGLPFTDACAAFPEGTKQPCWAAIMRSGRIVLESDGRSRARIFLPGSDPREAYARDYPVFRHALEGILASGERPLKVECYAYTNNYAALELSLNLTPYRVSLEYCSPPSGRKPLDVRGLEAFFSKGGELTGGKLDSAEGLVLFARQGPPQTLCGESASISDFAVAYRAVFYAGDNEAFVSLDKHADPTKVTVNFGGLLQDTRIGSVVLEADKRFKTITSGLDPNTYHDMRGKAGQCIPGFRTTSEIDLASEVDESDKWIGTRFWYYPESVQIDADIDYSYAVIKCAQFTAETERTRDDYGSEAEFESGKKRDLSPSIRESIANVNAKYDAYAEAFPELRELTVVARMMGVCSWLRRANPSNVDLDALLAVEIPPVRTERERTQLLSAAYAASVLCLTPTLDRPFEALFPDKAAVAKFLCQRAQVPEGEVSGFMAEAGPLFDSCSGQKVAAIVKNEEDLKALLVYAADPPEVFAAEKEIEAETAKLKDLDAEIGRLDSSMKRDNESWNRNAESYNALVNRYEALRASLNRKIGAFNTMGKSVHRISGGIELGPKQFTVRNMGQSPLLAGFRGIAPGVRTEWTQVPGGEKWVRSPPSAYTPPVTTQARPTWRPVVQRRANAAELASSQTDSGDGYWFLNDSSAGKWRDQLSTFDGRVRQRVFEPASKTLHVVVHNGSKLESQVVAEVRDNQTIVFKKTGRKDLISPDSPPVWWRDN